MGYDDLVQRFMERLISRTRIDFVGPGVNDRLAVEVVEVGEDPCLEFLLGCDANGAKQGAGHLGEEPLHKVEPGAMLRGEHEGESALWLGSKPAIGLSGDVCRVVVKDQLDRGVGWIGGIELFEKADELPRAMAVFDTGVHLTAE